MKDYWFPILFILMIIIPIAMILYSTKTTGSTNVNINQQKK